jgi:hypothetical protein
MHTEVYRILYCSRNLMHDSLDSQLSEIRKILVASRRNNAVHSITGALLFNSGCFAQVLEGPLKHVEATFERIQRDLRHAEVTVLDAGYVEQREFPEWSMAFAGETSPESTVFSEFSQGLPLTNPSATASEIREMLGTLIAQEDDYRSTETLRFL